jgi:hypothetical protein
MFKKFLFEGGLVGPQIGGFRVERTLVVRITCKKTKSKKCMIKAFTNDVVMDRGRKELEREISVYLVPLFILQKYGEENQYRMRVSMDREP